MRSLATLGTGFFLLSTVLLACTSASEGDDAETGSDAVVKRDPPPDLQESVDTLEANQSAEIWFRAEHATIGSLEFKGAPNLKARLELPAQQITNIESTGFVYIDPCSTKDSCLKNGTLAQDARPYLVRVRNMGTGTITVTQRTLPAVASADSIEETDTHSACRTAANGAGAGCTRLCGPNKASVKGECMASRQAITLPKVASVVGRCNAACR